MAKFVDFWKKAFHESSLLRNVIVLATGVLIAIGFALPFGIDAVIEFVTDAVIIIVITQVCGDFWFKLTREPEKLCWQYWVGVVGILGSDWLFMWASKSVVFKAMFLRIGFCVAAILATVLWFELVYDKIEKELQKAGIDELKKMWAENGVPEEVINKTLEEM